MYMYLRINGWSWRQVDPNSPLQQLKRDLLRRLNRRLDYYWPRTKAKTLRGIRAFLKGKPPAHPVPLDGRVYRFCDDWLVEHRGQSAKDNYIRERWVARAERYCDSVCRDLNLPRVGEFSSCAFEAYRRIDVRSSYFDKVNLTLVFDEKHVSYKRIRPGGGKAKVTICATPSALMYAHEYHTMHLLTCDMKARSTGTNVLLLHVDPEEDGVRRATVVAVIRDSARKCGAYIFKDTSGMQLAVITRDKLLAIEVLEKRVAEYVHTEMTRSAPTWL